MAYMNLGACIFVKMVILSVSFCKLFIEIGSVIEGP